VNNWDSARDDELPRQRLVALVKDEYQFRSDTAKMYVERVIDHFDMVEHPVAGEEIMVTEERRDEINALRAEEEADELAQAEAVTDD
jgi:type I site-specific restriction endonuclease